MAENNQELMKFVAWVKQTKMPDASPEEVVSQIQAMSQDQEQGVPMLQSWMEEFQAAEEGNTEETGMFKKGGKLDQLVEKRKIAKKAGGGDVNTPVEKNTKSAREAASKNTRPEPTASIKNRKVGFALDKNGGQHLYESATINGDSARTYIDVPQPGDTLVYQEVPYENFTQRRDYPKGSWQYEAILNRNRGSKVWPVMAAVRKLLGF